MLIGKQMKQAGFIMVAIAGITLQTHAADAPLWNGGQLPKSADISMLKGVSFHAIKSYEPEADGGYHWLHGVGLAWHKGKLYASFGHNKGQENTRGEQARGRVSTDGGKTWGEVFTIGIGDDHLGVSHGVFLSHKDTLWSFQGAFYDNFQRTHTRAFKLDEATGVWAPVEIKMADGFWPMQNPQKMEDGNWIMAGIRVANGYTNTVGNLPAVAISRGEDFTQWDLVVLPCDKSVEAKSIWGESTVIVDDPRITNISRWGRPVALASESTDYGRTWSPVRASNLPMAGSKPHAGLLSTGQRYLVCTTTADSGGRRSPLTIAISRSGETTFSKVFIIRPSLLEGGPDSNIKSSLSYPCAVEHDGKLYVGYSNSGGRGGNFNSAELAVIPVNLLISATFPAITKENPAAIPAEPNLSPGPEYADNVRMFQGIPGIECAANGRLWATWYSGGVTEDNHNYILLYTSDEDGRSWKQALVLDPDGNGPVRAFDPCLWHDPDGKLWLFWAQEMTLPKGRDTAGFVTFAITTTNSGQASAKWSAPRQIAKGVMMNKPTVAKDGRWLFPISTWSAEASARVVVSSDHGATFAELGAASIPDRKSRNADEHMVVERKDGSLWMLVRGKFPPVKTDYNGLGESISTDGGKTWSDVTASTIPHPVSRFFIRQLTSGRLLLVRHNPPKGKKDRSHLTAFLSEDDGLTWKGGLLLDERLRVSYPDGVQAPDGSVRVIYDHERGGPESAKEILMAVFRETDILAGKITSPNSRLRVLVNQATGPNATVKVNKPLASTVDSVWLSDQPVPKAAELSALEGVQFHVIKTNEPEKDGYKWLHGVALAWHNGKLYASFGHNKGTENTTGEEASGCVSSDGGRTWSTTFTIATPHEPNLGISHGVFLSRGGELWAFMAAFYGSKLTDIANSKVHTRAYKLNEATGAWEEKGTVIEGGFWPMQEPLKMGDGNWIMSGLSVGNGHPGAVAISHGDDLAKWDLIRIPRPPHMGIWGESTIILNGKRVQNFARINSQSPRSVLTAVSEDYGRTWTDYAPSNLPMAGSKPYTGTLSTGQPYLVCTTTAEAATSKRRDPLTIAVGKPGENGFRKVYRIRGSVCPESPGDSHPQAGLCYPYAVEHDRALYVGFSNSSGRGRNENSAELAIIPIASLRTNE